MSTVKKLEWKERIGVTGTFEAQTSIGSFVAYVTDEGRGRWLSELTMGAYAGTTLEAAKAAAQSDYEARILSALEPDDLAAQLAEAIRERDEARAELANIEAMLNEGQGDDDGAQIMPDFDEGMTTIAKVEECLHLLEKRRDVIAAYSNENWKDDPSADDRWNAGLDYGQTQLCKVLSVDPAKVSWDAATETLDGDVQSVIGNILTARFGDDWRPPTAESDLSALLARLRTAEARAEEVERETIERCAKVADNRAAEPGWHPAARNAWLALAENLRSLKEPRP